MATKTLAAKAPAAAAKPVAPARAAFADLNRAAQLLGKGEHLTLSHVPDGFDAFVAADLTRALARTGEDRPAVLVHVAREAQRAAAFREAFSFCRARRRGAGFPGLGLSGL